MPKLVCHHCRKPNPTVLLVPKGGYADAPRPSCLPCYDGDADGHGGYYRSRFTKKLLPDPLPANADWVTAWDVNS